MKIAFFNIVQNVLLTLLIEHLGTSIIKQQHNDCSIYICIKQTLTSTFYVNKQGFKVVL